MSEIDIQNEIRVGLSEHGYILFRNNTGLGWSGTVVKKSGTTVILKNARPVKFGLCNGSSDLIGLGRDGKFLALEIKDRGRLSSDQKNFIEVINRHGGIAGVAHSLDEALAIINRDAASGILRT